MLVSVLRSNYPMTQATSPWLSRKGSVTKNPNSEPKNLVLILTIVRIIFAGPAASCRQRADAEFIVFQQLRSPVELSMGHTGSFLAMAMIRSRLQATPLIVCFVRLSRAITNQRIPMTASYMTLVESRAPDPCTRTVFGAYDGMLWGGGSPWEGFIQSLNEWDR